MAPRRRTLPSPLPDGFILTDTEKKRWRVGKVIGKGGFGLIHLASDCLDTPVREDTDYVIKVEFHENGPLFSELKFYQRAAKPETINKWKRNKGLEFLGIPTYWGSGLSEYNGTRYRFMVMDRLGTDLQKVFLENGEQLKKQTVLQLGCLMLDVLEYIHENEYVHADIKAANLLLGHRDPGKVYLADYGLSYRYCPQGEHKDYKENPKKGHNGTIEYTSIDAHNGVAPSRRGDLQVLGYCLLHWQCGTLPWLSVLRNPAQVQEAKAKLIDNLPESVIQLSNSGSTTAEVARFLLSVRSLDYKEKPDYQALRKVLSEAGRRGPLDLSRPRASEAARPAVSRNVSQARPAVRSTTPKPAAEDDYKKSSPTPVKARPRTKGESRPEQKPYRAKSTSKGPDRSAPVVIDTDEDDADEKDEPLPPRVHPKTRGGTKQRQKREQYTPPSEVMMRPDETQLPGIKKGQNEKLRHRFSPDVTDRWGRNCHSRNDYCMRPNEEEEDYWGEPYRNHNHWEEDDYNEHHYAYVYSSEPYRHTNMNNRKSPENKAPVSTSSLRMYLGILIAVLFLILVGFYLRSKVQMFRY